MSEKIKGVDNEFFKGVDFGDMDKLDIIFAMQEKFVEEMRAARFYPHTDLRLYPTVAPRLP